MLNPFQSAWRPFLQKFGFAFLWAALFGALFGGLVYFRVPRAALEGDPNWHQRLRLWLEAVELWTYDWRVRELGAASARSDAVVPVVIDDDTLANARESSSLLLAAQPWPREVLGGLADQLQREGATLVLFDLALTDLSPRSCPSPMVRGDEQRYADDESLRSLLDRHPGGSLLTFTWSSAAERPAEKELRPYLLLVESRRSLDEAREQVRRILAERAPAFLVPNGDQVQLWVGVASEQRGKELFEAWNLKGSPTLRQRTAADRAHEVPPWRLLASLSEVKVEGLKVAKLPRARSLEGPVPVLLSEGSQYGAATTRADPDGLVRAYPHFLHFVPDEGKGYVLPSAPIAAAMQLAGSRSLRYADGRLFIGEKYSVPMDESGYALIRWDAVEVGRGAKGSLKRSLSVWRVLVNLLDHNLRRGLAHHDNDLTGRVAVLSDASTRSGTSHLTPIGLTPSSAVLGQALVNILRSDGISRASPRLDLLLTGVFALVGAVLAVAFSTVSRARAGPVSYGLALGAAGGVYLWVARQIFLQEGRWIAVAGPLLAMSATFLAASGYAVVLERRIRELIIGALGRYVPPDVASRLQRDLALMRPKRKVVTVCFTDIEGFGALAGKLTPKKLVALLNEFFTEMSAVVQENRGQVDKYVADSLMAFWGAPVQHDTHAESACESALMMREVLKRRRDDWEKRYGHRLEFRAGINTGEAVVGDMGAEQKSNYTAMGAPVAFASELEALNEKYGTFILVGQATCEAAAGRFVFREVDRFFEGATTTRIFELLGRKGALGEEQARFLARHEEALAAYYDRRFGEAEEKFEEIVKDNGDLLARRYAGRCKQLLSSPPPESWEGVYTGPEIELR
ncbi:MAG: CHASE2 domain-containing protein [Myxococcota bacterium]